LYCSLPVTIVNGREELLSREYLELSLRPSVGRTRVRRGVAARAHEVRRLMIKAKGLHRSDHRPPAATRDQ